MEAYLRETPYLNYSHPRVQALIRDIKEREQTDIDRIRTAYEYVRDVIRHSYDIEGHEVTRTAADVLVQGHGICYAKSHLLAAVLRGMDIPAGIGYQRLTLYDDPKDGYCIHAINTVYLREHDRWIRLDARGNKTGVDARFTVAPEEERLAFPVREEMGEIDYRVNYAKPHPDIVRTLEAHEDSLAMYRAGLPTSLVDYTIETADDDELPVVHRIMREAFEEYRDRLRPGSGALREEVADIRRKLAGRGGAILARWGGEREPVGSAQYYAQDDYLYIGRVAVVPQVRACGIGRNLMAYLERLARDLGMVETRIEVRLSLPGNIAYYTKLGYEVLEEGRYPDRSDGWYVMRKPVLSRGKPSPFSTGPEKGAEFR